jgi:hypothetical protein
VTVKPSVTGGDIASGLKSALDNPVVVAVIAGLGVWLITRK